MNHLHESPEWIDKLQALIVDLRSTEWLSQDVHNQIEAYCNQLEQSFAQWIRPTQ